MASSKAVWGEGDWKYRPLVKREILRISLDSLLRLEPFKRLRRNFFLSIYYSVME
jgi:hypothetical protein